MNAARLKAFILVALVLVAAAGAHLWRPTLYLADMKGKIDLGNAFPRKVGDWRVDDRMPAQLVSPDQAAMLNKIYSQTLSRTYVNPQGDRIMLSVAYGGDQSDATRAHRPEVCYPAQGFQVRSQRATTVPLGSGPFPVRKLVAQQGNRIEPIIYWMIVGEKVAVSGTAQKLEQLSYSTRGIIPDGMLVRVSSIDSDEAHAFKVEEAFVNDLRNAVAPVARGRIFGGAEPDAAAVSRVGSVRSLVSAAESGGKWALHE